MVLYFESKPKRLPFLFSTFFKRRLGRMDATEFKRQSLSICIGMSRDDLEKFGGDFVRGKLLKHLRPGGVQKLEMWRRNGTKVFLASGSPDVIIAPLARELSLNGWVATELAYDHDGRYTGQFRNGDCIGAEKAEQVRLFSEEEGIDLTMCEFYGDSMADAPLMGQVGKAVAVCPEAALKRHCRQESWAVEYW